MHGTPIYTKKQYNKKKEKSICGRAHSVHAKS